MSNVDPKATAFIQRLLSNPTMRALNPLQREEQILQFLQTNARKLYPTLATPAFFPNRNWEQISSLLFQSLMAITDSGVHPVLEKIVKDRLDLSFIQFLRQQNMPQNKIKEDLFTFVVGILQRREIRSDFFGSYGALSHNYVDRYLEQAFARKQYVHFELTKVQRLRMGKEEIKHFINLSLLLKSSIHIMTLSTGNEEIAGGTVQTPFMEKVVEVLGKKLPALPEPAIRSGIFANGSFLENRSMDATSRIAGILAAMCRNVRQNQSVDRGAVTADKSWINIARRNYKFYGFDIKMLDEFYKIAGENGW